MMQPMIGALRVWGLAAHDMLAIHPPSGDLGRFRRIANIVDDQNIADEPFHLCRDISVGLVDIEAMHALAVSLNESDQFGVRAIIDVVDTETTVVVAFALRAVATLE